MRYGLLSDIHGNAYALRAAINRLNQAGVDAWLCAGDIVGYGPQPNECVETLAQLDVACVAGNHELLVLDRIAPEDSGRLARETTPWTRSVLRDDCRAHLASLPIHRRLPGVVLAHASLADPQRYLRVPAQASGELRELTRIDSHVRVLVVGHTHQPWLFHGTAGSLPVDLDRPVRFPGADPLLVNPGSVGQSRQRERWPRARCALLDLDRGNVTFFAEPYDVRAALAALRRNQLPRSCIHVRPGPVATLSRRLRTLGRYVRRSLDSAAGPGEAGGR